MWTEQTHILPLTDVCYMSYINVARGFIVSKLNLSPRVGVEFNKKAHYAADNIHRKSQALIIHNAGSQLSLFSSNHL